ncbi:thymidylate synthase [bacterium]|nr:thymidylate synthase [bacterium]
MSNPEEEKFLNMLKTILQQPDRVDRTGVGTRSIFGSQLEFSLENQFPLLTTRRIPIRMVFEELMWMMRGQTDSKILLKKKVPVWEPNTTREFLDNRGLAHLKEGDIGESYGFQYRHWNAKYRGCDEKYDGEGFDQLSYVINLLEHNPTSRRIMMNIWNPDRLNGMALPPCLFCMQFYVEWVGNEKYLSLKITQRSSDISLAGGWNIATGSLLVCMLAHLLGMKPRRVIWSVGDVHIYLNQLDGVGEQVFRTPREFPTLEIINTPDGNSIIERICAFEWSDFKLYNYKPHPRIKLCMNA